MLQPMFGSDYSRIEYNRLASQAFMMLRVQQRCYADVEANVQERGEVGLAGMKVPSGDSVLRSMSAPSDHLLERIKTQHTRKE